MNAIEEVSLEKEFNVDCIWTDKNMGGCIPSRDEVSEIYSKSDNRMNRMCEVI